MLSIESGKSPRFGGTCSAALKSFKVSKRARPQFMKFPLIHVAAGKYIPPLLVCRRLLCEKLARLIGGQLAERFICTTCFCTSVNILFGYCLLFLTALSACWRVGPALAGRLVTVDHGHLLTACSSFCAAAVLMLEQH